MRDANFDFITEGMSGFRSPLLRAALIMSAGMCLIPLGDTAGKLLGATGVAPVFIAWSRFALGAMLTFAAFGGRGFEGRVFGDWRYWLRGGLIACGVTCILTALRTEPIANVFAAFFVGPILSYFLAAWLLRERITATRTALLFAGFCGVLVAVRPDAGLSEGTMWALLAGSFYGCFLVATKWLSGRAAPRSLLLSQLVIASLLLAPWGLSAVPDAGVGTWALVALSAAASAAGNLLYVIATRMADASRLAPLVYLQLVSATALGIAVFGDWPDAWSLAGLALLLASGFGGFLVQRR